MAMADLHRRWWRRLLVPLLLLLTVATPPAGSIYFFSRDEPVNLPDNNRPQHLPQWPPEEGGMAPCVCSLAKWCAPLQSPKTELSEVFAFVLNTSAVVWNTFDWEKLTTIVLFDFLDPEIVCKAHKHRVRVLQNANFLKANVTDAAYRAAWVARQVNYTRHHYLDGINVDFEDPVGRNESARQGFVQLMNETKRALSKEFQNTPAVLSVDVPWSPDCIDGRCYDFVGLKNVSDMFFVMSYDLRSQVFSKECNAGANSPLNQTLAGVRKYMEMGVPASQLVLGVPWYGYDYYCLNLTRNDTVCEIARVPFRGVNCSDSAARERPFSQLAFWETFADETQWSEADQSPFYNIKLNDWNYTHQIWFDNTTSLTYKYMGAASLKLRGLGIWAVNFLAAGSSAEDQAQRTSMWGALARWSWQQEPAPMVAAGSSSGSDGIRSQYGADEMQRNRYKTEDLKDEDTALSFNLLKRLWNKWF